MSTDLTSAEIGGFFRLLLRAYYDCALERLVDVEFYLDADVVIGTTLGFEDGIDGSTESRLVRSLMACAQLGEFRMVRPHALELSQFLERRSSMKYGDTYREQIRQHIKATGIKPFLNKLKEICLEHVVLPEDRKAEAVHRFIEILRDAGDEKFASIEALRGPWKHRYNILSRSTLRLDQRSLGPEMNERDSIDARVDATIMRFLEDSSSRRLGPRSHWANYKDACALSMISRKLKDRSIDKRCPLVRFYSETFVVQSAFDSQASTAELFDERGLAEDVLQEPLPFRTSSIFRNSEYFLLRFAVSELGFGKSSESHENLKALVEDLRPLDLNSQLVDLKPALLELESRGHLVGGRNLSDAITDFKKLRLVRAIWTHKSFSDVFGKLDNWTLVFDFAQNTTAEILDDEIVELQVSLRNQVHQIQEWISCFRKLKAAIHRFQKYFKPETQAEIADLVRANPESSLGLARWGTSIAPETRPLIAEFATTLVDEDGVGWEDGCRRFATILQESPSSPDQTTAVCSIIWMFGDYHWIYRILNALGKEKSPAFAVWEYASWIRCVSDSDVAPSAIEACSEKVETLRSIIEESDDISTRLGFGYFLFHCWRRIRPNRNKRENSESYVIHSSWLRDSLECGELVLKQATPHTLQWAFALNHFVYVGMEAGLDVQVVLPRVKQLLSTEPDKGLWNARFADTVACFYMWRIEHAIATPNVVRSQLQSWLEDASRYMRFALKNTIGDIAVSAHNMRLDELEFKVKSVN